MNTGIEPRIDFKSLEPSPGWIKESQPAPQPVVTPHTHSVEIPSITSAARVKRRRRSVRRKRTSKSKPKRSIKKRKTNSRRRRRPLR